jgi:hypothetical protein
VVYHQGATLISEVVPTKHPRIPVTRDDELDEALSRVEAIFGPARSCARRVHDLAVRGAAAIVEEEKSRAVALERLAVLSTTPGALFDRDVLTRIDEEAWDYDPEPAD